MAAIENPILNCPFCEPKKQFAFDANNRIMNTHLSGRRRSAYFVPVADPKRKTKQHSIDWQDAETRKTETDSVNRIRDVVRQWRELGWPDVTPVTRMLLEYWTARDRNRRLFFCQVEAIETIIFITEVAKQTKYGDEWIEESLSEQAKEAGTELLRMACKMATGSGKTVVMAMLIAWQTLNKRRSPKDKRFSNCFLIVTPGITIRDRLRVLLPSDDENYYRQLDVVPRTLMGELGTAKIIITNYHSFKTREFGDAGGLTKRILTATNPNAFTETSDEMVRRVCRDFGPEKEIIVLNDEAHHCYRSFSSSTKEKLSNEEKSEAKTRDAEARLWLTGLEAVHDKLGVKAVYDLSATPFYLKGSGYPEGTLFPWVISDFSLIDAIECGIVKVPRVPIADNAMVGNLPKYRDLWSHIREALPKKRKRSEPAESTESIPQELQGALESLYSHYQAQYDAWEADEQGRQQGATPPVFIVVCNNTTVSKLVYDHISGYETEHFHPDGQPIVAEGNLPIFSNVKNQRWRHQPNTILVDSEQFESGEALKDEYKKLASHQIDEFKREYHRRYPGRDADNLTDVDLMREVLNTVGKPGKLGSEVRCVVSVSMLTEGWDANTVTHILGVRAFGTRLLCEQVVGRALRRMSYALNEQGRFDPEYAEVFGVPFHGFVPCAGLPEERQPATRRPGSTIQALPERLVEYPWLEVNYPRVIAYRYEQPPQRLSAHFDDSSKIALSTIDIPTRTENAPIVGESADINLDDLQQIRTQQVAFKLATHLYKHYFNNNFTLFPQLLAIVRQWLGTTNHSPYVEYGDETFPGLLLFVQKANEVAEKIHRAIVTGSAGAMRLKPELPLQDRIGSTIGLSYDTVRTVWQTEPTKCHLNFVPEDSSWETQFVEKIERMDEVLAYVKNQQLDFRIPYTHEGRAGNYYPDYILKIDDRHDRDNLLHLIVEITGEKKKDKQAKVDTARDFWVPAVNNDGTLGRWAFLEIDGSTRSRPMQTIREAIANGNGST